jgi:hypothetical protein
VLLDQQVQQDQLDQQVLKEFKVLLDQQDQLDQPVLREFKVLKESKVLLDHLDQPGQ